MSNGHEQKERRDRADRLVAARKHAEFRGPQAVADKFGFNINTYKAHESGRNGFGLSDAKAYARAFKVSLNWLNFGLGEMTDQDDSVGPNIVAAPRVAWVSAGALALPDLDPDIEDLPQEYAVDLDPEGDWIALRVDGDSMNKISPHDSVIFVNRKDRRLVPKACYVIGDGIGGATYKRFRPPNTWEPVSTNETHQPIRLPVNQEPQIVGRVRRTVLTM